MGRPPLPIGTWGSISVKGKPGNYRARTLFRDFDGVTRPVERTGPTMGAARSRLTSALSERSAPSGDSITAESRLSEVAEVWFAERDDLATNTVKRYRDALEDHILGGVGNLRVREATVTRLDRFIKGVTENTGAPTAKVCASVLSGVMGLAVRHGAARTNPMRDVAGVTVVKKEPRALTMDEVRSLQTAVAMWVRGLNIDGTKRRGRPVLTDLQDIVSLLLATGIRIGELLAIRWSDVNLIDGSVTISGTIILSDTKPARPIRQAFRKGKKPYTLLLPKFAVDMLLRRQVNVTAENVNDAVFPSAAGTWRDPGNVRKQLDKVLAQTKLDWVTPHTFRKTVGTVIANAESVDTAADQLGQADPAVMRRHYYDKPTTAPDSRAHLERFAPEQPTPVQRP